MRRVAWLGVSVLIACRSSSERAAVDMTIPSLTSAPVEDPSASKPTLTPTPVPTLHASVDAPVGDDSDPSTDVSGVSDICALDPRSCKPMTSEMVASCHCGHLRGRDAQKCLIDCVARERAKVNEQLKQMGP